MSDGYLFHAATAPQNVDGVTVQRQKDTSITLKFSDTKHVLGNRHFYILQYGEIESYTGLHNDDRNYDGFIYHCGPNTEHFLEFFYHYYEDTYTVTSLSPGTKYNFTLYWVLNGVRSRGYEFTDETTPSKVTGLNCEYSWMGRAITLHWDAQFGLRSEFEVRVNRGIPEQVNVTRYQIDGAPSAVQYFTEKQSSVNQVSNQHIRCFLGERVNERNAADQPLDRIYVNTATRNTPENHNSSVESESKDTSGEINHYEAPDMTV
ncbi:putative receptor-type tyrosine-protein phosphatase H-like [Triplophysa rosa]|uniref:Receptor-type tyrosine-protein phosphatase H-like n=1 Tax=Triplophysa rosa TaxID=992332 RepID=A0A9W7WDB7_TRIRA|nr:putative receptor-type tyrosine-protein phosphatase H-like [Triplophysa rosa]